MSGFNNSTPTYNTNEFKSRYLAIITEYEKLSETNQPKYQTYCTTVAKLSGPLLGPKDVKIDISTAAEHELDEINFRLEFLESVFGMTTPSTSSSPLRDYHASRATSDAGAGAGSAPSSSK